MRRPALIALVLPFILGMAHTPPSGRLGVFAIVDRVVLEPNETEPDRIQIWGAFAYGNSADGAVTVARKGYMYFGMPPGVLSGGQRLPADARAIATTRAEWRDLKSVAGTGQAVAFGEFFYFGQFSTFDPTASPTVSPGVLGADNEPQDLRVRPASEPPRIPGMYRTNIGVVKLTEGSHGPIIKLLRDAK